MKDRTDTNRASLYAEVTSRVFAELEAGRLPWVQPASAGGTVGPLLPPTSAIPAPVAVVLE